MSEVLTAAVTASGEGRVVSTPVLAATASSREDTRGGRLRRRGGCTAVAASPRGGVCGIGHVRCTLSHHLGGADVAGLSRLRYPCTDVTAPPAWRRAASAVAQVCVATDHV